MGMDHFYCFIDRAVVDPVLQMSWREILSTHAWSKHSAAELVALAMEPEPDPSLVEYVLAHKTLRWTMKRSTPSYFFLNQVVSYLPRVRSRCKEFWPQHVDEVAVLEATATEAFLQGRIGRATLWAVNNIDGINDPACWLCLTRRESALVKAALRCGGVEKPVFPWQTGKCLDDGYRCLRIAETKRFVGFLKSAWDGNWPVPRLSREVRDSLGVVDGTPRFRSFEICRGLLSCLKGRRSDRLCTLGYHGYG